MTPNPEAGAAVTGKPQLFLYENGFLFCGNGLVTGRTERFSGQLLLATTEQEFEIEMNDRAYRQGAVVVKPFVPKALNAHGVPFISLGVSPNHAKYRSFSNMPSPGYLILPRTLFSGQRTRLNELRAGRLSVDATQQLFENCVDVVTALLPTPKPLDARIARIMQLLAEKPTQDLEALADTVCLSYYRLSHLFSQEMGVSLRQYLPWFKVHAACRYLCEGMSLTDTAHAAGFSDSAHLTRMWVKAFGSPPSVYLNEMAFAIQARLAPKPATTPPPLAPPQQQAESNEFADSMI